MGDLPRRAWFWGAVGLAFVMAVWLVFAVLGWRGEPDSCTLAGGNCYCEAYSADPVPVRQPVNTWSGLVAALGGLILLAIADRDRASKPAGAGPMRDGGFYAIAYGALAVFLGPGAMFFHAGLTRFGGWLDNMSMVLYVSFLVLYDASRIFRFEGSKALVIGLYAAVNVLFGILIWLVDGTGTVAFTVLAVTAVIAQIAILGWRPGGLRRSFTPWLLVALIAFGVAFVVWRLSWTGAPLCAPDSALQGHGLWHVLGMAATPFVLFFYLRDETRE